jgi:hypothetical protein
VLRPVGGVGEEEQRIELRGRGRVQRREHGCARIPAVAVCAQGADLVDLPDAVSGEEAAAGVVLVRR